VYRFEVKVPAGQAVRHEVAEEQVRSHGQELVRTGDDAIRLFLRSDVPSPKLKEALRKAVGYKQGVAGIRQELTRLQGQLKAIADDQARLRANIDKVPKDSAAYKRYLAKFDQQETQIEKLQARVEEKQEAEKARQKEYDEFLAALTVS
jgi:septal ring factor EnvC (AmiA/AmiB activator)